MTLDQIVGGALFALGVVLALVWFSRRDGGKRCWHCGARLPPLEGLEGVDAEFLCSDCEHSYLRHMTRGKK